MTGCSGTTISGGSLTVQSVDVGVTQSGQTLTAVQAGATYQWVSCPGYQAISGTTGQSFTPSVSGNYAVVVTVGGCRDTSACYFVDITTKLEGHMVSQGWRLYPNPSSGVFVIENELGCIGVFEIVEMSGRIVYEWRLDVGTHAMRIELPAGVYYVRERKRGSVQRLMIVE